MQTFETVESLKRYSYLVYSRVGIHNTSATGFFIRANGHLYLLSANHIFTDANPFTDEMPQDVAEVLYVSLNKPDNMSDDEAIKINVKEIKKTNKQIPLGQGPDVYACEVMNGNNLPVNSIGSLIPDYARVNLAGISGVLIYGYPRNADYFDKKRQVQEHSPSLTRGTMLHLIHQTLAFLHGETKVRDRFDYMIKVDPGYPHGAGYSGAPAFFVISNTVVFGGVCSGGVDIDRTFLIVKPWFVLQKIMDALGTKEIKLA